MSVYRFFGHVVNSTDHSGRPRLRVEAWDAEGHCTDLVAVAVTGARGEFTMTLDDEYLTQLFRDRSPVLTFRVFTIEEASSELTTQNMLWKLDRETTSGRIEVGGARVGAPRPYGSTVVRGTLRSANGSPLANVVIRAFDVTFSTATPETRLGSSTDVRTDDDGQYAISYYLPLSPAGRFKPDIVVRAYDSSNNVIVESQRICQAPATVIVNLVLGGTFRGASELDALQARLAPHQMDLVLREAEPEQLAHLACASGSEPAHVTALAAAAQLSDDTGVSIEAHYALVREGLPTSKRELLRLPQHELKRGLQNAVAKNTLPASVAEDIDMLYMGQLRSAAVDMAFEVPEHATASVGTLAATVVDTRASDLLNRYLAHEGTIEEFWASIVTGEPAPFTTSEVADLKFAFQIGALTRFHLPLIKEIQSRKASSDISSLRDLARYDDAAWIELLETEREGQAIGVPYDTPGRLESGEPDLALQKANYAKVLRATMAQAFPSMAIAGDVVRATGDSDDPVATFIADHGDFEFGKTRVASYVAQSSPSITEDTVARLRQIELLHKLTPRYTEMKTLLDAGLHSAREIVRTGKTGFLAAHSTALGGSEIAGRIFDNAQTVAAQALALHSRFGSATNRSGAYSVPNYITPKPGAQAPEMADWAELFGSPDFCDCDHCNSVYGPAAYFVDLLEFLDKHESNVAVGSTMPTAKDVLLGKRPDLAHIDLTCDNTLTALPYVDLVNEILEHKVAAASYPTHIATVGTTKDLRALPAIVAGEESARTSAYTTLSTASYPWALPFDLPATEARVYLNHLGTPRHELMRLLAGGTGGPTDSDIAGERLGLSQSERNRIATSALPATPEAIPALWGISGVTTEGQVDTALGTLDSVPEFLAHSGLSYAELVDLLDTAFAKDRGYPHINAPDPCKTSTMTIVWGDTSKKRAFFDAAHRFVRLAKRIGYSFRELDQAMTAEDDVVNRLSSIEALRARFDLPVAVVASWFGPLETYQRWSSTDPCYYDLVFQNKGVQNPPDAGLSLAAFSGTGGTVGSHAAAIQAALGIGNTDFALLTNSNIFKETGGGTSPVAASDTVSVDSLSALYRYVTIARALGLSVWEFLALARLCQAPTIEAFVAVVDRIRRSGFTVSELTYLFGDIQHFGGALAPTRAAVLPTLDALVAGLVKMHKEKLTLVDVPAEKVQSVLADIVSDATLRGNIWNLIDSDDPHALDTTDFDASIGPLCWDATAAASKLVGASALTNKAERYSFALAEMSMKRDGERLIQQTLASALKLDARTIDVLLRTILTSGGPTPLLETFKFLSSFPTEVPDPHSLSTDRYADQYAAYRHLDKAAMLVRRLHMTPEELLTFTQPDATPAPLFHLDALPRSSGEPATALFAKWQTLVDLLAMRSSIAGNSDGLLAIFDAADATAAAAMASEVTGWALSDIQDLISATIGISFGDVPTTAAAMLRLRDIFAALNRIGVTASTALGWVGATVSADAAKAIIQTAKSKHSDDDWATVAPPLRDVVREKQRASLVAYLMNALGYTDADQLFADLYVDVQMSPCQLTSRIKQAIGSVQTFVQRALLHLEPAAKLTVEAAREWSWRKSYRMWEANRKIFLYPENWIYPELRDDKSPFFEQLERELRQNDITDEVAEDAYLRYLESLEQVSRLEVVAMFHEKEDADADHEGVDVLHVVGRTKLEPYKHFYRTRVDGSYWTPWEAIDLEIEGSHLVLGVFNRRPHLFWPIIEKAADDQQNLGNKDKGGAPATKHLEVRLAWSEYRKDKWSARRVSTGVPITLSPVVDRKWLTFVLKENTKILCLLNPGKWWQWYPKLFRLGVFALDVCRGQLEVSSRDLAFTDPKAELQTVLDLLEKAKNEKDIDEAQAQKDADKALAQAQKAADAPALLQQELTEAATDEIALALPALTVRIYQDDKQIPDADVDDTESLKDTLTLPVNLDSGSQSVTVLRNTPSRFRVLALHALDSGYKDSTDALSAFFYKDSSNTYFVERAPRPLVWSQASSSSPGLTLSMGVSEAPSMGLQFGSGQGEVEAWANTPPDEAVLGTPFAPMGYRFWTFHHPFACNFLTAVRGNGVAGLLTWPTQEPSIQFFSRTSLDAYDPDPKYVNEPHPAENVDFSYGGAYSAYNWEIFFHIPFLVATRLMQNQRFDEAQKWFHYIFDPTSGGTTKAPQRFWKVKPFFENDDLATIQEQLEAAVSSSGADEAKGLLQGDDAQAREELDAQVAAWEKDPFNPHVIARLRPLAYQKAVVMKYIENIIAWGDQLFRQDTLESINEATQLYILASQLLGPRPVGVRRTTEPEAKTYAEIEGLTMGPFDDPLVSVESLVRGQSLQGLNLSGTAPINRSAPAPDLKMLLFCVPPDEMLLGLWDIVADRLFKLRHCMNIDGVVRQLPLFEPPIDPALLVRAKAAGVDLASALDDANPALPNYRFSVMHAKAMELASGVAALGGAFLSALEKKDAESLSRLRSGQEIDLLSAVREVKEEQAREAQETLKGLQKAFEVTTIKRDYYQNIRKVSSGEMEALKASGASLILGAVAEGLAAGAPAGYQGPNWSFGAAGWAASPVNFLTYGGQNIGSGLDASARHIAASAGLVREAAGMAGTIAGYDRRWDEWKLQERLANKELEQIEKQIAAAEIRVAVTEKELENHDLQTRHAKEVGDYLRDKFTNDELYDWMIEDLSTVFFQSYQLAYDVAKRAEKAYRFERAVESSSYIAFGYWDSLKKGLLAGEKLQYDLRRLEIAYLEQNVREYEITKHVSLASVDPAALMLLRETGACTLALDEGQFDMDFPGHYLRRIKSVSVTIPALSGPYTGVNCTLRLRDNKVRTSASTTVTPSGNYVPITQTIVTSSAQNDGGMFELNLRDERYLPFEGAGPIGNWDISLPKASNGFDVSAVSDVILHVRYTARDGGKAFHDAVVTELAGGPSRKRLISGRTELPDAWERFVNPADAESTQRGFRGPTAIVSA